MDKEILIIDGDEDTALSLRRLLSDGHISELKISSRQKLALGLKALSGGSQIVLLSDTLPDSGGLDALRAIKTYYPETLVIMTVPSGRRKDVLPFMEEGAFCFIEKPFDPRLIKIVFDKASAYASMREEIERLRAVKPPAIVCKSPEMLKTLRQIERAASTDEPVFISGEEGTGKELAARAVHLKSSRKRAPFVTAIASELLEGKAEALKVASGGSLYVKGIEGLPPDGQESLLKFASERSSSADSPPIDLRAMFGVKDGSGFALMDIMDIKLPPLRKRKEDIPLLARHFIEEAERFFESGGSEPSHPSNRPRNRLTKEAEKMLSEHDWPANVRELKALIRKAYAVSSDGTIGRKEILSGGMGSLKDFLEKKLLRYLREKEKLGKLNLYDTVISETEKALIELVLREAGGNKLRTASVLGISRNTLSAKMKEYKIKTAR